MIKDPCTRKKYNSQQHAEYVRDMINRKQETKRAVNVIYCNECRAHHITTKRG